MYWTSLKRHTSCRGPVRDLCYLQQLGMTLHFEHFCNSTSLPPSLATAHALAPWRTTQITPPPPSQLAGCSPTGEVRAELLQYSYPWQAVHYGT